MRVRIKNKLLMRTVNELRICHFKEIPIVEDCLFVSLVTICDDTHFFTIINFSETLYGLGTIWKYVDNLKLRIVSEFGDRLTVCKFKGAQV